MAQDYADVPVAPSTRDRLRAAKVGGESYDDVVNRLLTETGQAVPAADGGGD